ncbi:formate dehydrogenase accessory protein FdhE, partial [Chloroflexota bacterium]
LPSSKLTDDSYKNLLTAVIQATLKPFLISHAKSLIASVDQERWRRRYCPICGGSPDFASLDKERGSRWLLCSRCDTEWLFQRMECPYCGNQNQNSLAYFTDDKSPYRLYVCEQCKRYLKATDLRQNESEVLLPLERLYTLDIDRQAQEQGYRP